MVKFSDNVKLFLLFGVALALIITLSVVVANDGNEDEDQLETFFCENFTISDDEVRRIFADSFEGSRRIRVVNPDLQCLPEQVFDRLSEERIQDLETAITFEIIIVAPLVAVHPDAFKIEGGVDTVTEFTLNDRPNGTIIETGDNLLSPFFNLLELTLRTESTRISDTLVGDTTTLQRISIRENGNLELIPTFVSNQTYLESISFQFTAVDEVQPGLFAGLERFTRDSIFVNRMPTQGEILTQSDAADIYETDVDHVLINRFLLDDCNRDQFIRRRLRDNIHFDSDRDTTVIDALEECFPKEIFREFSDEELFALFPQDRDTSLLITSPLDDELSEINNIFDGPEGLFDRVTSVTFQGNEFSTFELENMFQRFIALEEVVFREIAGLEGALVTNLIGDPCQSVTKTFRFLNSLEFTTFPSIISFCPAIETLDFTGSLNFIGNGAELLNELGSLNEIILTNTALDIEQEGNVEAIAGILGVSPDIIVIN